MYFNFIDLVSAVRKNLISGLSIKENANQDLLSGVRSGDVLLVEKAIDAGADINFGDGIALRLAASKGDIVMAQKLIAAGAEIEAVFLAVEDVATPVSGANNQMFMLDFSRFRKKKTPLIAAIENKKLEMVDFLINHNAQYCDVDVFEAVTDANDPKIIDRFLKQEKCLTWLKAEAEKSPFLLTNVLMAGCLIFMERLLKTGIYTPAMVRLSVDFLTVELNGWTKKNFEILNLTRQWLALEIHKELAADRCMFKKHEPLVDGFVSKRI